MHTYSNIHATFTFNPDFSGEIYIAAESNDCEGRQQIKLDAETLLRFVDEHRPQPAVATPAQSAPPSSALVKGLDGAFYNAHDLQWFERSGFSDGTGDCLLQWRLRGWDCEHRWCGPEAEADAFVNRMLAARGEVEATETTSEATLTSSDDSSAPAPDDCKSHDGTAWAALSDIERGAITRALPPGDEAASAELNALLEDSQRLADLKKHVARVHGELAAEVQSLKTELNNYLEDKPNEEGLLQGLLGDYSIERSVVMGDYLVLSVEGYQLGRGGTRKKALLDACRCRVLSKLLGDNS